MDNRGFKQLNAYSKITSNFSNNGFGSVYDSESPSLSKGLRGGNYNTKPNALPATGSNLEYRNLKNFNWIKDKMGNDLASHQKLERP